MAYECAYMYIYTFSVWIMHLYILFNEHCLYTVDIISSVTDVSAYYCGHHHSQKLNYQQLLIFIALEEDSCSLWKTRTSSSWSPPMSSSLWSSWSPSGRQHQGWEPERRREEALSSLRRPLDKPAGALTSIIMRTEAAHTIFTLSLTSMIWWVGGMVDVGESF